MRPTLQVESPHGGRVPVNGCRGAGTIYREVNSCDHSEIVDMSIYRAAAMASEPRTLMMIAERLSALTGSANTAGGYIGSNNAALSLRTLFTALPTRQTQNSAAEGRSSEGGSVSVSPSHAGQSGDSKITGIRS